MAMLALKTASGVAATCGWTAGKALARTIILLFAAVLWLAVVLTAIWPLTAAHTLVYGSAEMREGLPFYALCWVFNAGGLFIIALDSRRRGR